MPKKANLIDVKILKYISSKFEGYIQFREKQIEDKKWKDLFKNEERVIIEIYPGIKFFLYKDNILSKLIYNGFEEDEISFIHSYLETGDYFFDIGANVGLFSLIAASKIGKEGKIFSFEPTPSTYNKLLENIGLNKFENITPINIGLSDKEEYLKLKISDLGYDAWNTFAPSNDIKVLEEVIVPVKSLDDVIKEYSIDFGKVSLIKIDVEGWEKFVLNGATSLIASENAPVFLMEFTESNTFNAGYLCQDLYDLMEGYGFKWYSYNKKENCLNWDKKRLHYPYNNLIAVKNQDKIKTRIRINE